LIGLQTEEVALPRFRGFCETMPRNPLSVRRPWLRELLGLSLRPRRYSIADHDPELAEGLEDPVDLIYRYLAPRRDYLRMEAGY